MEEEKGEEKEEEKEEEEEEKEEEEEDGEVRVSRSISVLPGFLSMD